MPIVPEPEDPGWEQVITGRIKPGFQFLGTKILLSRLIMTYQQDPGPVALAACANDFREFFIKNVGLPQVQSDLQAIFRQGGDA